MCDDMIADGKLEYQRILVYIPEEIFDQNMEYVCIKQEKNTEFRVVREHDLHQGDTAVRIFIPSRYFHNVAARQHYLHPESAELCQGVSIRHITLDHYVGIGMYFSIF